MNLQHGRFAFGVVAGCFAEIRKLTRAYTNLCVLNGKVKDEWFGLVWFGLVWCGVVYCMADSDK